jgi:hypothetical protein
MEPARNPARNPAAGNWVSLDLQKSRRTVKQDPGRIASGSRTIRKNRPDLTRGLDADCRLQGRRVLGKDADDAFVLEFFRPPGCFLPRQAFSQRSGGAEFLLRKDVL